MRKEAHIIIHQLRTAVLPQRKLAEIKRDLAEYDENELDQTLSDLDDRRQELMANDEHDLGEMLNLLISDIRLGVQPQRPRIVPKRF